MLTSSAGGPLSWVHPEIEVALGEVSHAIDGADWGDAASRILALAHLHQVSGALHMVELPGPQRLAAELEQLLGGLSAAPTPKLAAAAHAAIAALRTDLDARLAGRGGRDLDLLPALQGLGRLRDISYGPCELFLPDLAAFPAGTADGEAQTDAARRLRAEFQRAMLLALRDPDAAINQRALTSTLVQVSYRAPGCFGKARWELLAQVLSELPYELADPAESVEMRRLLTAIDRQLRRNCSPADSAGDEVMREALYLAGSFPRPSAPLQSLLHAARVPELLAVTPAAPVAAIPADARLVQLAELLAGAEATLESWFRAQGTGPLPPALCQAADQAAGLLDALGDDEALLLLDDVRQALAAFPAAAQLSEARLEPVAERLAGLHQFAAARAANDGEAALRLHQLRERLAEQPAGAGAGSLPAAGAAAPDLVPHQIDERLFSVFIEEADQLLRDLYDQAGLLVETRQTAGVLAQARSCLQTLRGSGLVAGLLPLAQLCGEVDHTLAAWVPSGERPWDAPAQLLDDSARAIEKWLARLATDRKLALPAVPLIDRARALRAQPALALSPLISLQDIFLEEAGDRLGDLRGALGDGSGPPARPAEALRAAHTLAGIARTAGHPGMAELARAAETLLEALGTGELPTPEALARLRSASDELTAMRASLLAGHALQPAEELARALRRDADLLHEQRAGQPQAASAPPEAVAPASPAPSAPAGLDRSEPQPLPSAGAPPPEGASLPASAPPPAPLQFEPLVLPAATLLPVSAAAPAARPSSVVQPALDAESIDHPDSELLPVFLEECAELLPQLDAALRAWSEGAGPEHGAHALKRGLHTLKGSARMTGLMRQGARAHRLEDLVLRWSDVGELITPQAFDEIQAGLDDLALGIERLAHPERAEPPATALPADAAAASADAASAGARDSAPILLPAESDTPAHTPPAPVGESDRTTSAAPSLPANAAVPEAPAVQPPAADLPSTPDVAAEALQASDATSVPATEPTATCEPVANSPDTAAQVPVVAEQPALAGSRGAGEESAAAVPSEAAEPSAAADHGAIAGESAAASSAAEIAESAASDESAASGEPTTIGEPKAIGELPAAGEGTETGELAAAGEAAEIGEPAASGEAAAASEPAVAGEAAGAAKSDAVSPLLRIRVESLDRMSNAAGEAGIGRARLDTEAQSLKRGLGDLAENIQRLKSQLREIEIHAERALPATVHDAAGRHGFDPLELDRYSRLQELARTLAEGIDDVHTVHQGLRRGVDEMELALRQQGRVIRDLQQDLLRARMVPFASLTERLKRTARQAARESGRELSIRLEGSQHEIDRSILERLAAPLEHLLRNAAAHGIEPPDQRRELGKPRQGTLSIVLTPGEHEVALRISDDGRGVDLERVRAQAEASGLLAPQQSCSAEELLQLIFRPGFSTAHSVTSLAGRGVGLDVVRSEVIGLGGRIHIDTRPAAGTDFTLVIPVTLATVQAVVVRAGESWFAIPAPLVEQVRPVPREALAELYRERVAHWQGLRYPFTSLDRVLGLGGKEPEPQGTQQLVFLRSGDRRCALRVDELAGAQEVVVKTVSPHLARIPGVSGASVLGNGRIVLILNPVPLAVGADGRIPEALLPAEPMPESATVMVVDDSITVRRVTTRLLERAGYQVRLAKDGQDALDQLGDVLPDAMLLDVEMPRMDGFELITRLRADPRTAALPVVVITSRTAERHRSHAESLGVQGYLGKPYRDEDLTGLLAGLLRERAGSAGGTPRGQAPLSLVR